MSILITWCQNDNFDSYKVLKNKTFVEINDLINIETLYNCSFDIYSKNESGYCFLEYMSQNKNKDRYHFTMHLIKNKNKRFYHVKLVTDLNTYLSKFVCNSCGFIFSKKFNYIRHLNNKCSIAGQFKFVGGYQELKPLGLYEYLVNLGYDIQKNDMHKDHFICYDFETYGKKIIDQKVLKKTSSSTYLHKCVPFCYSVQSTICKEPSHFCDFDEDRLISQFIKDLENLSSEISKCYKPRFDFILTDLEKQIEILENEITNLENKIETLEKSSKKNKKDKKLKMDFFNAHECFKLERKCESTYDDILISSFSFIKSLPKIKHNRSSIKLDIYHLNSKLKEIRKIHKMVFDHIFCHSVAGFNSGNFDINLVRDRLLIHLQNNKIEVLKKCNRYLLIKTPTLKFVDILNFVPPNTSLDKFCKNMTPPNSESDLSKGHLPYDKIDSIDAVLSHDMPLYHHFFNILKGKNSFEENIDIPKEITDSKKKKEYILKTAQSRYKNFQKFWKENNFNMQSYIAYYCNRDTHILLEATKIYASTFRTQFQIELFNHISLPQISRKLMKIEAFKSKCILSNFSKHNSWIYYALKASLCAGSSQVYSRFADTNSFIEDNKIHIKKPNVKKSNMIKQIKGLDCTSMYARALMGDYPTNNPICYVKNEMSDDSFEIKRSIQYRDVYLFTHFLENQLNVKIQTQISHGYEIIKLGYPLDGFIEKSRENKHLFDKIDKITNTKGFYQSIAIEFNGCFAHSHPCHTRDKDPFY